MLVVSGACGFALLALVSLRPADAHKASARLAAATSDFGHAPDGKSTGYLAGAKIGEFPSTAAHGGPQHTDVGKLFLGTSEDGEPHAILRKVDPDDEGAMVELHACKKSTLTVLINPNGLPASQRTVGHTVYVNAWFDWNRNGHWGDASDGCASEWAIENLPISAKILAAGKPIPVAIPFTAGRQVQELWYRVQVTLDEPATDPAGHGGFKPYTAGETEDYLIQGRPLRPAVPKPKFKIKLKRPIFEEENEEEEEPEPKEEPSEPPPKKGKFKVSCAPNPAIIPHGAAVKVKFLIKDEGSGLIFGTRLSSTGPGGSNFGLTPVKPQPKGVPAGWVVVDGFTFKSTHVDPPLRVVHYSYKFLFRRGKFEQKLICHVLVVHFPKITPEPPGRPRITFPPICRLAGINPTGSNAGICTLPPPCPRICGGPFVPLPPLPGVSGHWEQKPSSIQSFFDVFVELQLPAGVDTVSFPLRGQSPPWPWAQIDPAPVGLPMGLNMPSCTLAAPQGGPPALECPVSSPGRSFFDIFTDINLPISNGGAAAPKVNGELWSAGKDVGSFSLPLVPPACPAGYTGTPPNCTPPPPPPEKCQPGYTGTPPNCVKFEGFGTFQSTGTPAVLYALQFNQQTPAYEIQLLGAAGSSEGCRNAACRRSKTPKTPYSAPTTRLQTRPSKARCKQARTRAQGRNSKSTASRAQPCLARLGRSQRRKARCLPISAFLPRPALAIRSLFSFVGFGTSGGGVALLRNAAREHAAPAEPQAHNCSRGQAAHRFDQGRVRGVQSRRLGLVRKTGLSRGRRLGSCLGRHILRHHARQGEFAETWETFRSQQEWEEGPAWEVKHIEELERDRVLVETLSRARGARSGIEVTRRSWHLYEYRGPKVARVRWFNSREEALADLALAPESCSQDS